MVNQHLPHGARRYPKEMIVAQDSRVQLAQLKKQFTHQRRGLQRMPRTLSPQQTGRDAAQPEKRQPVERISSDAISQPSLLKQLEHFISEKLEERIAQKLGNPEFDPHGDIIPGKDGTLPQRKTMALADVPPRSSVIVSSVSDRDPEMLRYLERIGLTPNRLLTVIDHGPFEGPTTVRLHDEADIRALGPRLAAAILVRMT